MEKLVNQVQQGKAEPIEVWLRLRAFIHSIAKKYEKNADIDDLMQESYFAILSAIRLYDDSCGTTFENYAYWWINRQMKLYVDNYVRTVRIPTNTAIIVRKYRRVMSDYEKTFHRKPSEMEICEALSVDPEQLTQIEAGNLLYSVSSLDVPVGDGQETTITDLIPGETDVEGEVLDKLEQDELKKTLWGCVGKLPRTQAETLRRRFQYNETLQQIADDMGVSAERVRQIEHDAVRAMQRTEIRKQLEPVLDDYRYSLGLRQRGAKNEFSSTEYAALKAMKYFNKLQRQGII